MIIDKFKNKSLFDVFYMVGSEISIKPLQLIKSIIVAKYLGPSSFGILKSVELIQMLNKFGSLGFKPTIIRNVTTEKALGNETNVINIKNTAYTSELILSIFIFILGISSSLFFENFVISTAIILSSLGLFTLKIYGLFQTELRVNKEFKFLSKLTVIQGIVNSLLIILTVPFFEIYAVLIIPIISSLLICFKAFQITGKFFLFKINLSELKKILSVSLPLTFGTLAFGIFKYSERIIIITFLGLNAVGLFGFAETIVNIFINILIGSVLKVRGIKILEDLSVKKYLEVHKMIYRETGLLILVSIIIIIIIAFSMNSLVPIFLPNWKNAISITILYSLSIPIKILSSYIAFVIKSPIVENLKFEPIMHLINTFFMFVGLYILKNYFELNLYNFLLVVLIILMIMHLNYVLLYIQSYYFKFVYKK